VSDSQMSLAMGHGAMIEESPYGIESKKLVMWLFIIADAATFGALLFGYGYLRAGSPNWTRPFTFAPTIINGIVMTFVPLTSSLTMLGAVGAAKAGQREATGRWLGATIGLGVVFAALHLREWFKMFAEGWSPSANPEGGSVLFGASFFGITGLHLLHVIGGVVAMLAQTAADPTSTVPTLGASGAIAAVMGAFLTTYPRDRIRTVLFIGFFFTITFIPAFLLIGLWFVIQRFSAGTVAPNVQTSGGVAYLAHVGGFAFGLVTARLFEDPGRLEQERQRGAW